MIDFSSKAQSLQPHYSEFDVAHRLLFSGHSHQAWPDVAREGVLEAFEIASKKVDYKWATCFSKIEILRDYLRSYYNDSNGYYSYAHNTHDLLIKWVSALDIFKKRKIVSSGSEFHSAFRLFTGLNKVGIDYKQVEAYPLEGFASRFIAELDENTAGVVVSHIFFDSSLQCIELPQIVSYCKEHNIPMLIDDYHGTNVEPIDLSNDIYSDAFVLIGGYKYLQWGEGNCFLRHPKDSELKPSISGWFASFSSLRKPRTNTLEFDGGDSLYMGATIEPTSAFRAAKVVEFFKSHDLSREYLRATYKEQLALLYDGVTSLGISKELIRLKFDSYPIDSRGGFLALETPFAQQICDWLTEQEIFTDARGNVLRVGPAPYNTREQIEAFVEKLDEGIKFFQRS